MRPELPQETARLIAGTTRHLNNRDAWHAIEEQLKQQGFGRSASKTVWLMRKRIFAAERDAKLAT